MVLKLGCAWESPGNFLKIYTLSSIPKDPGLIELGFVLVIRIFQSFSGDIIFLDKAEKP